VQKAIEKRSEDRYSGCGVMASALRQAAAQQAVTLVSVATTMNKRDPSQTGGPSKEVVNWIARIRAVIDRREFETAERLIDTALNDFPGSLELAQMRSVLPSAARPSPVSGSRPRPSSQSVIERTLEQLQNLLALEKQGKIPEALTEAERALREDGDNVALKVAAFYFARLADSPTRAS
jgi:hypothetical protein